MDYTIHDPSAPGVYESEKLGDRAQLHVNEFGQALTVVSRYGVEYTHPILRLDAWAAEYGPFRLIDGEEPPTDPGETAATKTVTGSDTPAPATLTFTPTETATETAKAPAKTKKAAA